MALRSLSNFLRLRLVSAIISVCKSSLLNYKDVRERLLNVLLVNICGLTCHQLQIWFSSVFLRVTALAIS